MKKSLLVRFVGTALIAFVAGIAVGGYLLPSQSGSMFGGFSMRPTMIRTPVITESLKSTVAVLGTSQMNIFVRDMSGSVWLEHDWGFGVPPPHTPVDSSVSDQFGQVGPHGIWRPPFQAVNNREIFVLGLDGKLWLETAPFGPSHRVHVDDQVSMFEAIDDGSVFVLANDHNLWIEYGPFGNVPPHRNWVGKSIAAFQALDANTVFALDNPSGTWGNFQPSVGNLWLTKGPFASQPSGFEFGSTSTVQVDSNVANFCAVEAGIVYVQGGDFKLWKETGNFVNMEITQSNRLLVDQNVNDFQPFWSPTAGDSAYVATHDGSLWYESGGWGNANNPHPPPVKRLIDTAVLAFMADPMNHERLFVRRGDLSLWFEEWGKSPIKVDENVYACQPLWPTPSLF